MPATYNNSGSPKENLRGIRILCLAMIAGVTAFTVVAIALRFLNNDKPLSPPDAVNKADILLIVCGAVAVICLYMAFTGYAKKIREIRTNTNTLNGKLGVYRIALIRYMAFCEAPAIFGIIVFIVTGTYYALAITAAGLAAIILKAPFGKKVIRELNFDWKDQQELE